MSSNMFLFYFGIYNVNDFPNYRVPKHVLQIRHRTRNTEVGKWDPNPMLSYRI